MKEIVSDTGSLISLEKLEDGFSFITSLYDTIIIPPAVATEISQKISNIQEYKKKHKIENLIEIREVEEKDYPQLDRLDDGEIEAIKLALQLSHDLLIEERKGKLIAKELGLKASGITGQIFKAYKLNILDKSSALRKLQQLIDEKRLNTNTYNTLKKAINT